MNAGGLYWDLCLDIKLMLHLFYIKSMNTDDPHSTHRLTLSLSMIEIFVTFPFLWSGSMDFSMLIYVKYIQHIHTLMAVDAISSVSQHLFTCIHTPLVMPLGTLTHWLNRSWDCSVNIPIERLQPTPPQILLLYNYEQSTILVQTKKNHQMFDSLNVCMDVNSLNMVYLDGFGKSQGYCSSS